MIDQPLHGGDHRVCDKLNSRAERTLELLVNFEAQFLPCAVHGCHVAGEVVVHYCGHFFRGSTCSAQFFLVPGDLVDPFVED